MSLSMVIKVRYRLMLLGFISLLLILSILIALATGPSSISISEIFSHEPKSIAILFRIRLPRIILGLSAGASLSMAGVILQALFRNPLVEPYTLGLSGGASLGVALGLLLRLHYSIGNISYPLCGFAGAFTVILFLYTASLKKGVLRLQGLLLTGVMISFICSSLLMLIMALSRLEDLHGIIYWMMGSLDETDWSLVLLSMSVSILCFFLLFFKSIELNALILGEEEAHHLGINIESLKKGLFIIASILTGVTVSITGVIGFVGLVVPHILRALTGSDHRFLIPGAFLGGGLFLLLSDTVARSIISPLELPVGVITGIAGGGLFIYILLRRRI